MSIQITWSVRLNAVWGVNMGHQICCSCAASDDVLAENAEAHSVIRELRQKLAIAGVEGSPPPSGDTTIGTLLARKLNELAYGSMKPHSDEAKQLALTAKCVIRQLVEDWL